MLGELGQEGDDVVPGLALDGVDARDARRVVRQGAALAYGLGRRVRDGAERGHGVAGMGLDLVPDAKAVGRLPDLSPPGPAVAWNHVEIGRASCRESRCQYV